MSRFPILLTLVTILTIALTSCGHPLRILRTQPTIEDQIRLATEAGDIITLNRLIIERGPDGEATQASLQKWLRAFGIESLSGPEHLLSAADFADPITGVRLVRAVGATVINMKIKAPACFEHYGEVQGPVTSYDSIVTRKPFHFTDNEIPFSGPVLFMPNCLRGQ